jgi:hypothetical protein
MDNSSDVFQLVIDYKLTQSFVRSFVHHVINLVIVRALTSNAITRSFNLRNHFFILLILYSIGDDIKIKFV